MTEAVKFSRADPHPAPGRIVYDDILAEKYPYEPKWSTIDAGRNELRG